MEQNNIQNKLNDYDNKIKEVSDKEKQLESTIKIRNDVSYHRVYDRMEIIVILVCAAICAFLSVGVGLAILIVFWLCKQNIRISPIGEDKMYFTVPKKEWTEYRHSHNIPWWQQYAKKHVAKYDIDKINNQRILDAKKISAEKEKIQNSKKDYANEVYAQIEAPFKADYKNNEADKIGRYYFDPKQKAILKAKTKMFIDYKVYHFADIVGYVPIERGHNKNKKHGITRSVVGGAIAGGVGAIVGASTGGKQYDYIDRLGVQISFKDNDSIELLMIRTETDRNGFTAKMEYKTYYKICSLLDGIINDNRIAKQQNTSNQAKTSVADEIAKYKKLLDDGAITQEEFDEQKAKLLH